jgi:hypothetical protein
VGIAGWLNRNSLTHECTTFAGANEELRKLKVISQHVFLIVCRGRSSDTGGTQAGNSLDDMNNPLPTAVIKPEATRSGPQ